MITTSPEIVILIAVLVIVFDLFITQRFFRALFSYEITDKDITVRLFHALPIYRIPFKKIVNIRSAPLHEVMLVPGVHVFTRPFARNVVIEMKDRWFIFAFLTPDDPDAFIAAVKRRLA